MEHDQAFSRRKKDQWWDHFDWTKLLLLPSDNGQDHDTNWRTRKAKIFGENSIKLWWKMPRVWTTQPFFLAFSISILFLLQPNKIFLRHGQERNHPTVPRSDVTMENKYTVADSLINLCCDFLAFSSYKIHYSSGWVDGGTRPISLLKSRRFFLEL